MKLLLIQSLPWVPALSGAAKANRVLMAGLAGRGHECKAVATASVATPGEEVFRCEGVEVHALADRRQLRQVALAHIRAMAPDWVLVSSEDPGQELLEAALEAAPERVIYLVLTPLHLPVGSLSLAPSERRTELIRRCAGVLTISRYLQDSMRRFGGVESTLIHFPIYGEGPFPLLGHFDRGYVTLVNPCDYKGLPIFLALARALPDVELAAVPTWGTTEADRAALASLPNVTLLPPAEDIGEILARTRVLL
ncbi:MAG TPA: hypothetical protein VLE27_13810, partial [Thermoanaerobaculia bacterium]|nr:hypothetical protein [Thermoanaerobaculia bacterium]